MSSNDLQELLDKKATMDVMIRYATSVDNRDLERYRTCFVDDVQVVGFGDASYPSADDFVAYVREALERFGATQHLMGNQVVEFQEGGDVAHTYTDVQATHFMADDPEAILTLYATYFDIMVRIDGEWKIRHHELRPRGSQTTRHSP